MPWPYQLPLCNYRTMTAGPSHHCQQVIVCRHLTVKGFLFERKAHCVLWTGDETVFLHIHEQQTTIKSPCRFYTCAGSSLSSVSTRVGICADARHIFSFPCIRGTISIVCAVKTIAPLKISRLIGLFQYSRLKVLASLE